MRFKKSHLFITAALLWGVPGIIVAARGIIAYTKLPAIDWWMFAITLAVIAAFYMMFTRIVAQYSARIEGLSEPCSIWDTFPRHGWVIVFFMMGLGITLRLIHIPTEFFASFYSGLGPMLILAALRFLRRA